jgi:hypothetical protein
MDWRFAGVADSARKPHPGCGGTLAAHDGSIGEGKEKMVWKFALTPGVLITCRNALQWGELEGRVVLS